MLYNKRTEWGGGCVFPHSALTTITHRQLWRYNEGDAIRVGIGHSGEVGRLKICPNQKHIVSVSADGRDCPQVKVPLCCILTHRMRG